MPVSEHWDARQAIFWYTALRLRQINAARNTYFIAEIGSVEWYNSLTAADAERYINVGVGQITHRQFVVFRAVPQNKQISKRLIYSRTVPTQASPVFNFLLSGICFRVAVSVT